MEGDYNVLALDLGSSSGFCRIENGVVAESGIVPLVFDAKHAHPGDKFKKFVNFLNDQCSKTDIHEIAYEYVPRLQSLAWAKIYCGLVGHLDLFTLSRGIRYSALFAPTIKKQFTGNHLAKKHEVCATCHKLGWKGGKKGTELDHDEADAIALAFVILKKRGIDVVFP